MNDRNDADILADIDHHDYHVERLEGRILVAPLNLADQLRFDWHREALGKLHDELHAYRNA